MDTVPMYNNNNHPPPPQSKKRGFPGSSSSSAIDLDVVEIPQEFWASSSKSRKPKKMIDQEVIDIDIYEDLGDLIVIGEKIGTNHKGKDSANGQMSTSNPGSLRNRRRSTPVIENQEVEDDVQKKLRLFKQFDTVEHHSDHHFSKGSAAKKPAKNWAKKIQDDWRILEKDLPDTIFVRVYETRMDLMRAVIVGAQGTPYHDGLFFFDISFPGGYPNSPPKVHYHSGGLRINPNLYNCGKVCLSLLNTWQGSKEEKWIPSKSTMLQVLVSIQSLILNEKPYFNEPGYANSHGTQAGEQQSQHYSENVFIYSLKTMVYTMRRPPKYFEDFVIGHFSKRARDILLACKAYTEGAPLCGLARGGIQDVEAGGQSCSQNFKSSVASHLPMLVAAFKQIGVKDCEKFLSAK